MARLENVITTMVEMFAEYADDQGNKRQLCQQELQELLEKEIESSELKARINPEDIKKTMIKMDKSRDGEINIREFCRCVSMLTISYYHNKYGKEGGKGKGKGKGRGKGKGKGKGRRKGRGKGEGEDEDKGEGEGKDNDDDDDDDDDNDDDDDEDADGAEDEE